MHSRCGEKGPSKKPFLFGAWGRQVLGPWEAFGANSSYEEHLVNLLAPTSTPNNLPF